MSRTTPVSAIVNLGFTPTFSEDPFALNSNSLQNKKGNGEEASAINKDRLHNPINQAVYKRDVVKYLSNAQGRNKSSKGAE